MSEPVAGRDLAWLERRRAELFGLISQAGDFRRGALNAVWRKCGKPNCACARPGHRGHGPQWNLTRRVGGKTVNVHLKPGPELEKVQREVAEHQRFADLVEEVTAVSEAICAARPAAGQAAPPPPEGERGGSPTAGLLSYPDAKITATNRARWRSAPAINPDERSGLDLATHGDFLMAMDTGSPVAGRGRRGISAG